MNMIPVLFRLLTILLAAGIAAAAEEEPASPSAEDSLALRSEVKEVTLLRLPDSYVELYRAILDSPESAKRPGFKTDAALASVALRLWERTHEEKFRTIATDKFAKAFSDPTFELSDFHILHHFGELIWRMKRDGLMSPDQQRKLTVVATRELAKYLKQPDDTTLPTGIPLNNIRIAQTLGYAGLLRFLEGEPFDQRDAVRKRLDNYLDLLVKLGNTDEDAGNYDSLGMAFAVDLARLLGRENDLKTPALRRDFENFREIVSPSGIVPEYGDSYFHPDWVLMDRLFLMEAAARIYVDPSFLTAARKMKGRATAGLPDADGWIRSLSLIDLPDRAVPAQAITGQPSQVLLRNAARGGGPVATVPDKLILRTGREPGDSMVMMDLYASGSHAHRDKGPSVAYYESAQVPLFHNLGRHGVRSAIAGNICWAVPHGQDFPGLWLPGRWFTWNYPVELCATNREGGAIFPKGMGLRNFPGGLNSGCQSLIFDNLRLTGPSGTLLVDGFDVPAGWSKNLATFTAPVSSPDKTEGAASQFLAWNRVKTQVIGRSFSKPPAPFSKAQYPLVQLDVKYEGTKPYMLVRGLGEEVELGAHVLRPHLLDASAEQRGRDSHGQLRYEGYITADSTLVRRLLLTSEGYLVIRDTLTPGPSMNGWNAGQLWQLYALQEKGTDWFCSADDGAYLVPDGQGGSHSVTRRMLVKYATDARTSAFCEEVVQPVHAPNPKGRLPDRFFTTGSRRLVNPGETPSFTMVVVPHSPASDAKAIAAAIHIIEEKNGATVDIQSPATAKAIHLRMEQDGRWNITRN